MAGLILLAAVGRAEPPGGQGSPPKLTAAQAEAQINPKATNFARSLPRVLGYDEQADRCIYLDSRTVDSDHLRPGGSLAYYGTRLTKFRFAGPAERGGLYADLTDYREQTQLDPKRYQYRFGNYARYSR
jgi:hypothetical protein